MNTETDLYRQLQEHLDKLPIGYPKTDSGVEIKILQHLFNPFEAKVALCLSLGNASLETVQKRMKRKFDEHCGLDDLQELARLATSGAIKPVIDQVYQVDQIVEAHRAVDAGRKRGSIVIRW